jgi:HlyD family secretion protein
VASFINASGTLVPEEVVDVGAQVAGRILRFGEDLDGKPVNYRSRVGMGKALAYIDDSLYAPEVAIAEAELAVARAEVKRCEADLEGARTKLDQAGRDLERAKRLSKTSSIAAAELEGFQQAYLTAQAAVPAAEATLGKAAAAVRREETSLKKARTNLELTTIFSPVDGVVIDRRVNIGQTVVASLNAPSLFLIAKDLRRMEVWASVNEADIGRVSIGQKAAFKVDAYPDRVFEGAVQQVRLNASMTNNVVTYTVVVSVNNDDLKLLPYLTANLQLKVDARDQVLRAPNAALRYRPPASRVAPEAASQYADARSRRATSAELTPGAAPLDDTGTLWVERGGYLHPILVRTLLTDGTFTGVEPLREGELSEGDEVVTGEASSSGPSASSNPFALKMFGNKKKERD